MGKNFSQPLDKVWEKQHDVMMMFWHLITLRGCGGMVDAADLEK